MSFELADAVLPVPDRARTALRREWQRLAAPGTWCDGPRRVAVAAAARAAWPGAGELGAAGLSAAGLPEPLRRAAAVVAAAPATITGAWVEGLLADDVTVEQYVEVTGVAARLAAVDTYVAGVGATPEPLPAAQPGEPARRPNPAAVRRAAFVPTEPEDAPPAALSAVPAERDAQMDLHSSLYLTVEQMSDLTIGGHLSRPQMELLAARTSQVNGCGF